MKVVQPKIISDWLMSIQKFTSTPKVRHERSKVVASPLWQCAGPVKGRWASNPFGLIESDADVPSRAPKMLCRASDILTVIPWLSHVPWLSHGAEFFYFSYWIQASLGISAACIDDDLIEFLGSCT